MGTVTGGTDPTDFNVNRSHPTQIPPLTKYGAIVQKCATVFAFNWANTRTRVLKKLDYICVDSLYNLALVKSEFVTMIFGGGTFRVYIKTFSQKTNYDRGRHSKF